MQRANSLEKTLMLQKTKGRRRKGRQRMKWFDGITNNEHDEFELILGDSEGLTGKSGVLQSTGSLRLRHNLASKQQE